VKLISPSDRAAQKRIAIVSALPSRVPYKRKNHYSNRAYIEIKCGHLTTPEDVELFLLWRPNKNKYFCEQCGKWVVKKVKRKVEKLPEIPLF
jgi:hypothetical protein